MKYYAVAYLTFQGTAVAYQFFVAGDWSKAEGFCFEVLMVLPLVICGKS